MTATIFDSVGCASATRFDKPWPELVAMLKHPTTSHTKKGRLLKLATFGNKRNPSEKQPDPNQWSLKHDDNVLEITGIEGDYDAGLVSVEQANAMLEKAGMRATVYTSWSDGLLEPPKYNGGPRWRVLAPLSKPYPPTERTRLMARLNGALGGILADESFTLSQGYFFSKRPDADYKCVSTFDDPTDGTCIDDLPELDEIAIGKRSKPTEPSEPGKPTNDAPIGVAMFEAAVAAKGGLLGTGDGRRELLKSYIASRSKRGLPADDIRLLIDGIAARYFDPADPLDEKNIAEIIKHFAAKDAAEGFDDLMDETTDPTTGETVKVHPLARFVDFDGAPKPPRWVLPGFVGHGVVVISGAQGVGKTTALLPLAMTAAGLHGGELMPCEWRHVVFVTEDVEQAKRILAGITLHSNLGIDLNQVRERLHIVEAVRLDPAFVATVGSTYRERFTRSVDGVEVLPLVVLDTKSAVLALESENDNSEASRMMASLKQGFDGLPVWLIGHLAKTNLSRTEVSGLTSRGASAIEADANQTLFLVREGDTRFLVLGKTRFEPKWAELEITSYTAATIASDEFGDPETVVMRWGIAAPAQQSRKEASQQAAELAKFEDEATLRQDIRDAIDTAWRLGNPLNREGVKAKLQRKNAVVVATLENLLSERWLHEVFVPAKERLHPRKSSFFVDLTTTEHEAVLRGEPLPADKLAIPESWRKPPVSSVPEPAGTIDQNAGGDDGQ